MAGSTLSWHIEKHKLGEANGLQKHVERLPGAKHSNEKIDDTRTHLNIFLSPKKSNSYSKRIEHEIKNRYTGKRSVRKDAVVYVSQTVQLGGEILNAPESTQIFLLEEVHHWLEQKFGKENILSSVIHLDETNPHLHFDVVPLTADGRMSAKEIFSRGQLQKIQNELLSFVQENFPTMNFERASEVERGFKNGKSQEDFERLKEQSENLEEQKVQLDKFISETQNKILAKQEELEKHYSSREEEVKIKEANLAFKEKMLKQREEKVSNQEKTLFSRYDNRVAKLQEWHSNLVDMQLRLDMDKQNSTELSKGMKRFDKNLEAQSKFLDDMMSAIETVFRILRELFETLQAQSPVFEKLAATFSDKSLIYNPESLKEDIHSLEVGDTKITPEFAFKVIDGLNLDDPEEFYKVMITLSERESLEFLGALNISDKLEFEYDDGYITQITAPKIFVDPSDSGFKQNITQARHRVADKIREAVSTEPIETPKFVPEPIRLNLVGKSKRELSEAILDAFRGFSDDLSDEILKTAVKDVLERFKTLPDKDIYVSDTKKINYANGSHYYEFDAQGQVAIELTEKIQFLLDIELFNDRLNLSEVETLVHDYATDEKQMAELLGKDLGWYKYQNDGAELEI